MAAGTYRGHAELKDLGRRIGEVFDEFRYDFDEYLAAGDRVVAIGAIRVRGAQAAPLPCSKRRPSLGCVMERS